MPTYVCITASTSESHESSDAQTHFQCSILLWNKILSKGYWNALRIVEKVFTKYLSIKKDTTIYKEIKIELPF